jgi:hypothetical protein
LPVPGKLQRLRRRWSAASRSRSPLRRGLRVL